MNVVIYDTRHYEMVNVLFRIFSTNDHRLLFLISESIYKKHLAVSDINLNEHAFVIQTENESSSSFFKRCNAELKNFDADLFIFNTIDKDYKDVWKFIKTVTKPYFVTIHNINTWLKPPFTLNRIALRNYYFRKKIVEKSSALIVQEELFIKYIKEKELYKKDILTVPHTLKEFEPEKTENKKIVIAIPGAIDGIRRDIDLALDVIEEVNKRSDKFQFVFTGNVIGYLGEPIWERAVRLQQQGLDIQKFYDPTTNKVFDEQMKRCDLIFLPLVVNTRFEGIQEIYGTTKVTGVIYDMMRFGKPGIVPSEMVIPPTMAGSILSYKTKNELTELILSLEKNANKLNELKRSVEHNANYYTVSEIRKRVLPQVQKKLEF